MWGEYPEYVPVARRLSNMGRFLQKKKKKGLEVRPVELVGRKIATSFWGQSWCSHLESYADYYNRLERGRRYVRNGSVGHLAVEPGYVEAVVAGSSTYEVSVTVAELSERRWKAVKSRCAGKVGSALELLQGRLSDEVMSIVTNRETGLFPHPDEIELSCSCPDWADMCKHVAAVLYGIGSRLDAQPEALFVLRGVDPEELIGSEIILPTDSGSTDALDGDDLSAIFGVEIDDEDLPEPSAGKPAKSAPLAAATVRTPKYRRKGERNSSGQASEMPLNPSPEWIEQLRKRLGLTHFDFAVELGVAEATLDRWLTSPVPLKLQSRSWDKLNRVHQDNLPKNGSRTHSSS